MRHLLRHAIAITIVVIITSAAASADKVVYDSFEPNLFFDNGWETASTHLFTVGMSFTPDSSLRLKELTAPWAVLNETAPASNTLLTVALFNDAGGHPATILESWTVLVTAPFNCTGSPLIDNTHFECAESIYTLRSQSNPGLLAAQTYWLFVQAQPMYELYWGRSSNGPPGGIWIGDGLLGQGPFAHVTAEGVPALQVVGAGRGDAPEPASLTLILSGLIVMLPAGYRKLLHRG